MKRKDAAQQLAFDFETAVEKWTFDKVHAALNDAGITGYGRLDLENWGNVHDTSTPYSPRSCSFPVNLTIKDGVLRLWMNTPAAGSLPFVGKVEATSGVKAVWDEYERPHRASGRWYHAVDLCNDKHFEHLLATRQFTTDTDVARAVAHHLWCGDLGVANARRILGDIGASESADRSEQILLSRTGSQPCRSTGTLNLCGREPCAHAWAMVHGLEDGLLARKKGKGPYAVATPKFWSAFDKVAA